MIDDDYHEQYESCSDESDDLLQERSELATRFDKLADILYFTNDASPLSSGKITQSMSEQRHIIWDSKQHYLKLGARDGFFFKVAFKLDGPEGVLHEPRFENYRIRIPWSNVCYICSTKNQHEQIKIGLKICVQPIVQKLDTSQTQSTWTDIERMRYPKSVQNFCSHAKFIFKLAAYQYPHQKIKDSILHHKKIMPHQRIYKFRAFCNKVKWTYDDTEKSMCQSAYRSAHNPCLQDHHKIAKTMVIQIQYMFDGSKGRICAVCNSYVGYFEQHAVCIDPSHTLSGCDSNIIEAIYRSKFDNKTFQFRRNIGLV